VNQVVSQLSLASEQANCFQLFRFEVIGEPLDLRMMDLELKLEMFPTIPI